MRDIEQLYCKVKRKSVKNGTILVYEVCAVLKNQTHLTLVSDMEEKAQAQYIEYQIEKYLGIIDARVSGELRKS